MTDDLSKKKIEAVLKAIDKVIDGNAWDESAFLHVVGKKLRDIRAKFVESVSTSNEPQLSSQLANRVAIRSDQQEVFILLYSSDGGNLQSWERIVANLPRQIISRPIYADENEVKNIIKSKENKVNEAYVSSYVNKVDVLSLPADKAPRDRLGKMLLTLKDNAVSLENINYFIHLGMTYRFVRGKLIKNQAVEAG